MKYYAILQLVFVFLYSLPVLADENNIWADTGYEPTYIDMELVKVSEHVYYVQGPPGTPTDNDGFMSNASVVITKEGVVVFDALGTPSLGYLLLSKIREVTDKPVRHVIVSHYHADHIYGLQVFKEEGADIIAPLGARDYLASDAAEGRLNERRESLFPWVNETTYIVKPDTYIDAPKTLALGDITLQITPLGSTHSEGDLMVMVNPDRVLLAADLIFEGRIPFVAGSKPKTWLNHLNTLDPAHINVIIPGHGAASKQPASAVTFTRGYLEYLQRTMGNAVEELIPFDEAYKNTDWTRYEKLPAFMVNRMNAYFMYLNLEAESMK